MCAENESSYHGSEGSTQWDALPILDINRLLVASQGDTSLIEMIIDLFLDKAPEQITALQNFLHAEQINHAALSAHTLKGSAAEVGGSRLRGLAESIEYAARDGKMPLQLDCEELLQHEFLALCEALRTTDWSAAEDE